LAAAFVRRRRAEAERERRGRGRRARALRETNKGARRCVTMRTWIACKDCMRAYGGLSLKLGRGRARVPVGSKKNEERQRATGGRRLRGRARSGVVVCVCVYVSLSINQSIKTPTSRTQAFFCPMGSPRNSRALWITYVRRFFFCLEAGSASRAAAVCAVLGIFPVFLLLRAFWFGGE
jgi:hypothetical protein